MLSYKPTDCLVNMISNLIKPGKSWNLDLMNLFFSKNEAITISIIPLSQCDQVDSIVWSPNQSGPYTVRWVIKKPAMFGQFDFHGSFIVLLSSTCPVEDYLGISCPPPPPKLKFYGGKCVAMLWRFERTSGSENVVLPNVWYVLWKLNRSSTFYSDALGPKISGD